MTLAVSGTLKLNSLTDQTVQMLRHVSAFVDHMQKKNSSNMVPFIVSRQFHIVMNLQTKWKTKAGGTFRSGCTPFSKQESRVQQNKV